jgi:hypothetical protein
MSRCRIVTTRLSDPIFGHLARKTITQRDLFGSLLYDKAIVQGPRTRFNTVRISIHNLWTAGRGPRRPSQAPATSSAIQSCFQIRRMMLNLCANAARPGRPGV